MGTAENTAEVKRPKKLKKDLSDPGSVKITVAGGKKGEQKYDTKLLSKEIREQLVPFGAGHKLGDSAAGKSGIEAEEAIEATWKGLLEGKWTVRVPASPKVSLVEVAGNYEKLSDREKKTAQALLASLGIKIPGISQ